MVYILLREFMEVGLCLRGNDLWKEKLFREEEALNREGKETKPKGGNGVLKRIP